MTMAEAKREGSTAFFELWRSSDIPRLRAISEVGSDVTYKFFRVGSKSFRQSFNSLFKLPVSDEMAAGCAEKVSEQAATVNPVFGPISKVPAGEKESPP
jgi:hypothetical protein